MHGTWKTTGGSPVSGKTVLLVASAVVVAASGMGAELTAMVADVVIALAVVTGLIIIGGVACLVSRARHSSQGSIPAPLVRQLAAPERERPALKQSGPRELHQHYHFHGVDPGQVAEILRRGGQ